MSSISRSVRALDRKPSKLRSSSSGVVPGVPWKRTKKKWSSEFHKFVAQCLCKDPAERATAASLLKHDFIQRARKPKYLVKHLVDPLPSVDLWDAERTTSNEGATSSNHRTFGPAFSFFATSDTADGQPEADQDRADDGAAADNANSRWFPPPYNPGPTTTLEFLHTLYVSLIFLISCLIPSTLWLLAQD